MKQLPLHANQCLPLPPLSPLPLTLVCHSTCESRALTPGTRADDAKELLTKIGHETSLRYAIHLISASSLIASKRKATEVGMEDVSRAYMLFVDVRRSVQYMMDYQEQYMYNQVPQGMANGSGAVAMQA